MEKAEFKNTSPGVCGVTILEPGGKPKGIAVKSGDTIWLTEEEQILTANAPRKAEDNPFVNGTLTLATEPKDIANRRPIGHTERQQPEMSVEDQAAADKARAEQDQAKAEHERKEAEQAKAREEAAQDPANQPPARLPHQGSSTDLGAETGLQAEPVGDAPEGERAQAEEVGTPEAEPKPAKAKPVPVKAKAKA
jgi:hypothetical protein